MATRKLEIVIAGDASGAVRAFGEVDRSSNTMGQKLGDIGRKMTVGVTVPAIAAGVAVFSMASDMNESLSKSANVFDEHGAAIERWADGAAEDFGQSEKEALDAAATFGNLFDQLGIGGVQTADMSQALTELASDFASFHNVDISQVIEAQTAAFRGEFDAVQRFVPTINAAAVQQKAMEMGLARTTAELDEQDKALATYQLLVEGAGEAMGDFDRTADGAANKQRILTAQFKDGAAELGQNLMPIGQQLLDWAGELFDAFNALGPTGQKVVLMIVGLAAAIGPLIGVIQAMSVAIGFLAANPIVLLIAAVALLAVLAVTHWDEIREAFGAGVDFIQGVLTAVGAWIANNWGLLLAPLTLGVSLIAQQIVEHWDGIVAFITGLPGRIASAATGMWSGVWEDFRGMLNTIIGAWNDLRFPAFTVGGSDPLGPFGPSLPSFTIGGWNLPDIPMLASGGVVTRPTLAMLGESGREAVVPLDRAGGFGRPEVIILQLDGREVARVVRDQFGRTVRSGVPADQLFAR